MKIKPCPFCGGEAIESDAYNFDEHNNETVWTVQCGFCDCEGPPGWDFVLDEKLITREEWIKNPTSSKEAAIFRWNQRKGCK